MDVLIIVPNFSLTFPSTPLDWIFLTLHLYHVDTLYFISSSYEINNEWIRFAIDEIIIDINGKKITFLLWVSEP